MIVLPTDKPTADAFVRSKHYSRRQGFFRSAYALCEGDKLEGVAVFGEPPLQVAKHAFRDRDFPLFELVRVVVQTKTANAASFLVAGALNALPKPCAVVSYADSAWGHCGIIYQATNWLYAGSTTSHDCLYLIDGERIHPRTLASRGITNPKQWARENGIETVAPSPKHRYVFVCGDRRQKKSMLARLKWELVAAYPKSEHTRYDDGARLEIALDLV